MAQAPYGERFSLRSLFGPWSQEGINPLTKGFLGFPVLPWADNVKPVAADQLAAPMKQDTEERRKNDTHH